MILGLATLAAFAASDTTGGAVAESTDAVSDALRDELRRDLSQLSLPDAPPVYHLRYQLVRMDQVDVVASLGSLVRESDDPFNALGIEIRVGTPEYDNTGFGGWQNGFESVGLAQQLDPWGVRLDAWRATDRAYKDAVEQ